MSLLALRPVEPDEPCDRCGHASKYHGSGLGGSSCRVASGARVAGARAKECLCDGFAAKPRKRKK